MPMSAASACAPAHPCRPAHPTARRRPARRPGALRSVRSVFFLASRPQHLTRKLIERLPIADLLAAGATLGAFALWGLAFHLLIP